jgi:hypothetical protein
MKVIAMVIVVPKANIDSISWLGIRVSSSGMVGILI